MVRTSPRLGFLFSELGVRAFRGRARRPNRASPFYIPRRRMPPCPPTKWERSSPPSTTKCSSLIYAPCLSSRFVAVRARGARAMLSLTSSCRMMPRLCAVSSAAQRLARHLAPLLIIYFPLPPLVSALALPLSLLQRHLYDDLR